MLGLFMLLPVLAVYASDLPGSTPLAVGLAVGVYGLTQAGLQIPLGWASDRIGRRPVVVLGLLMLAGGSVAAAWATTAWQLVAARALQGAGAVSGALTAAVADGTRPSARNRAMAILGMCIGASFLLALVMGPGLAASFGVDGLFLLIAAAAVLALPLSLGLPAGRPATTAPRGRLRMTPVLIACYGSVLLLHAMLTGVFVRVPLELVDLGVGMDRQWLIYVTVLLASLPGTVALVLSVERAPRLTLVVAISLTGVAGLGLALAGGRETLLASALTVFFMGFNLLEARLPTLVSLHAAGSSRGAAMGGFATAQFGGAFLGGLLGGPLAQYAWGVPVLMMASAALMIALSAGLAEDSGPDSSHARGGVG